MKNIADLIGESGDKSIAVGGNGLPIIIIT
jgi:hypothetical protein